MPPGSSASGTSAWARATSTGTATSSPARWRSASIDSFLIPATGDRVPCVYVEGPPRRRPRPDDPIRVDYSKKIGDEPTGKEHPELLKMKLTHGHDMTIVNGISRIGWMTGGKSARWVDEDMARRLHREGGPFIEGDQGQAVLPLLRDARAARPARAARAVRRHERHGPRGDAIQQHGLGRRRDARHARPARL